VQGNRTVGIDEKAPLALRGRREAVGALDALAQRGHDAAEAVEAIAEGRSKFLMCLGGNLAVAMPDPARTFAAMRGLEMAVHVATKPNRSHLLTCRQTLLLPCLGRTELDQQADGVQSITVEDSMSMVHASTGRLPPPSDQVRSEPAIVAGIAQAVLGAAHGIDWQGMVANYDRIRDGIEAVLPAFENYNRRIQEPGGFRLPLGPTRRVWHTASGRAQFLVMPGIREDPRVADSRVLTLATLRSHDQYNTTIYGFDDRYRGIFGRRDVVFVHADDLREQGIAAGDRVDLEAVPFDGESPGPAAVLKNLTAVAYDIPRGSAGAYYPEANVLIALAHRDPQSGTPSYKSVPVRLRRCAGP
jgi:molybdopterin-dependent oxidoreductase alpha subunit